MEIPQSTPYTVAMKVYASFDHNSDASVVTMTVKIKKPGGLFADPSVGPIAVLTDTFGWCQFLFSAIDTNTLNDLVIRLTGTGADAAESVFSVVPATVGAIPSGVIPAGYLGDISPDWAIDFTFNTVDLNGLPVTLAGSPVLAIYQLANGVPIAVNTVGLTLNVDYNGKTGFHHVQWVNNNAIYPQWSDYSIVIFTGTVAGRTVNNIQIASVSVNNRNYFVDVHEWAGVPAQTDPVYNMPVIGKVLGDVEGNLVGSVGGDVTVDAFTSDAMKQLASAGITVVNSLMASGGTAEIFLVSGDEHSVALGNDIPVTLTGTFPDVTNWTASLLVKRDLVTIGGIATIKSATPTEIVVSCAFTAADTIKLEPGTGVAQLRFYSGVLPVTPVYNIQANIVEGLIADPP